MSLIDEALKKTQSSLGRQKTEPKIEPTASTEPILQRPTASAVSPFSKAHFAMSARQKRFSFSEIPVNPRWIIAAVSVLFLMLSITLIHAHLANLLHRYASFYGNLFDESKSAIQKKTVGTPIDATPFTLDGTMHVNNERVALINGGLYHKGETVDGYQVAQIRYDHVLLVNPATHEKRVLMPTLTQ